MQDFLRCFIPLFVAIDPLGLLPVFLSVTATASAAERRRLVFEAVPTAAAIAVLFFLVGRFVLKFLGIEVADLQIAGGALLFVYAMIDLAVTGKPAVSEQPSLGIVPLATPLIAGPAVLTLGLVLMDRYAPQGRWWLPIAALLANLAILMAVFLGSELVLRVVRLPALRAASKVIDLLLAAIGVAFIREGVVAIVRAA